MGKLDTRFSVVRYGNVINSKGSVIPYFKSLLKEGKTLTITDERMTRFLITLEKAVEFVLKSFERMQGGEIFVPKIPSMKVTDIALALSGGKPYEVIGIRAGEKLHEAMITKEDSLRTIEFDDHFIIKPTISFTSSINYDNLKDAKKIEDGFEYTSDKNSWWLTKDEFLKLTGNDS